MELETAVRRRRMTRSFDPRPVPRPLLVELLDLARRAPSAGFSQGFEFLVLDEPAATARFWDESGGRDHYATGVQAAPVLVLPLADAGAYTARYAAPDKAAYGLHDADRWPVPFWLVDTAFATMILQLAAVDRGLGSLFFGLHEDALAPVLEAFGVPDGISPIGVLALGYPAADDRPSGSPLTRARRPLDEVVHWGRFGATPRVPGR